MSRVIREVTAVESNEHGEMLRAERRTGGADVHPRHDEEEAVPFEVFKRAFEVYDTCHTSKVTIGSESSEVTVEKQASDGVVVRFGGGVYSCYATAEIIREFIEAVEEHLL